MIPDWFHYVDVKRQKSLAYIFRELSNIQKRDNLNFIIIGALSLLIHGYLKYKVCWDVDLLFKNEERLKEFLKMPKSSSLKIINYDDGLMVNKNITSFHTAWAYNYDWFNVDCILKKDFFEFYTHDRERLTPYIQSMNLDDENFHFDLYMAHPWDIITDKVISPRTERELDLKIDMSIDIRHIYTVYKREKDNVKFWLYVFEKAQYFGKEKEFKKTFLYLLSLTRDLGYEDIEVSSLSLEMLEQ